MNRISIKLVLFKSILRNSTFKMLALPWNKNIMIQKYNRKDSWEPEMMAKKKMGWEKPKKSPKSREERETRQQGR